MAAPKTFRDLNDYRFHVLREVVKTRKTVRPLWDDLFKSAIEQLIPTRTGTEIFDLGDHLSSVFQSGPKGRDQSALKNAGDVWEFLVLWYLNIGFHGTNAVVINPKKSVVPEYVYNALTVNMNNFSTNTESDLIAIGLKNLPTSPFTVAGLSKHIQDNPGDADIAVIQCKTNWNDNAQIPMLWNMVYDSTGFSSNKISVGKMGAHIDTFRTFAYSFVTVPSNWQREFKQDSMPCIRVSGLSGGNYWGRASEPGVATSLKEYFTSRYRNRFPQSDVPNSIRKNLIGNTLDKYLSLNF